eukprot:m.64566 g.64566  ORF g.64566 m.64566 type:complete len:402 (+) comp19556_c0_seq1:556-1761(+)
MAAWSDLYEMGLKYASTDCLAAKDNPCTCQFIICGGTVAQPDDNRIRSIHVAFSETQPPLPGMPTGVMLPDSIGLLTALEYLQVPLVVGPVPESLGNLSSLRSAHFSTDSFFTLPSTMNKLERLAWLEIRAHEDGQGLPEFDHLMHMCSIPHLRVLDLDHVAGKAVLPDSFGQLSELMVLSTFESGDFFCPPKDIPNRDRCRLHCRVLVDNGTPGKAFRCPAAGLGGPIPDSFKKLRRMEKFWVDANFLTGPVPDWLPDYWPNLRSLDLFDNDFVGEFPQSYARLQKLEHAQLQCNDLHGVVPRSFFELPRLRRVSIGQNPQLGGCVEHKDVAGTRTVLFAGTQIEFKESCATFDQVNNNNDGGWWPWLLFLLGVALILGYLGSRPRKRRVSSYFNARLPF